jgi:hypothetical protein
VVPTTKAATATVMATCIAMDGAPARLQEPQSCVSTFRKPCGSGRRHRPGTAVGSERTDECRREMSATTPRDHASRLHYRAVGRPRSGSAGRGPVTAPTTAHRPTSAFRARELPGPLQVKSRSKRREPRRDCPGRQLAFAYPPACPSGDFGFELLLLRGVVRPAGPRRSIPLPFGQDVANRLLSKLDSPCRR